MTALPKRYFTPEEYLALEDPAEYKSQYIGGEIFAMAGTQPVHNVIAGNIFAALHTRFPGRSCRTYFADVRLRVEAAELYTYPDLMALCNEPIFEQSGHLPSLLNPEVIFEVLSPSTEAFDRGDKFARYRKLDSLTDYILVSCERMRVEQHTRQPSGVWTYAEYEHPSKSLVLQSVGCDVPLEEIYAKVPLPAQSAEMRGGK